MGLGLPTRDDFSTPRLEGVDLSFFAEEEGGGEEADEGRVFGLLRGGMIFRAVCDFGGGLSSLNVPWSFQIFSNRRKKASKQAKPSPLNLP